MDIKQKSVLIAFILVASLFVLILAIYFVAFSNGEDSHYQVEIPVTEENTLLPNDDGFVPDVNLNALNSVMLSGIVNRITNNHDEYIGKTTQVRGMYFNFFCPETNEYFHVILIEDQAGCCQYGFQFRVSEDYYYQIVEDLADGTMIEFRGVFQSCDQFERPIIYLATERIFVISD